MPTPEAGESKDDYIGRCIPIVLDEGTAGSQDQAVAICNSMWEKHMTGKSLEQKAAVFYKAHRDKGIWLTPEEMRKVCPACADTMEAKGWTKVNIVAKAMPEQMLSGLCDKFGGDPGFFTRCSESGIPVDDLDGFCAWLHNECVGSYPAEKSGARHSSEDRKLVRDIRGKAKEIHDLSVKLEPDDEDPQRKPFNFIKGEGLEVEGELPIIFGAVKAVGDWELEVLGVPFGGPNAGKDSDGEYFSEKTKTYADQFPTPLVTYYHGYDEKGKPQGDPEIIGMVKRIWKDAKGWWYHVVLNKASQYAKRIWTAARNGMARASSGSMIHLTRRGTGGEILTWPVGELALIDAEGKRQPSNQYAVALPVMKAHFELAGLTFPENLPDESGEPEAQAEAQAGASAVDAKSVTPNILEVQEKREMDELEVKKFVADSFKAYEEEKAARAAVEAEKAEVERLKKENEALKKEKEEAAKARRLPGGEQQYPYIAKHSELWQFDNLSPADQAILVGVLEAHKGKVPTAKGASEAAVKALAMKLDADKGSVGEVARQAMKAVGMKSDEVDYSTLSSYGDEWVGIAYSQALWEAIRVGTFVLNKIQNHVEVPRGVESIYLPLESTDPVWYKVAENTTYDSTSKTPVPTVSMPSSAGGNIGTGRVQLTLAKLGARVMWTGELEERSLIPFAAQVRQQLEKSGAEYLESAIIDGDNISTAATNINDIAATGTQAGTEHYMVFDGFRVSPLVTTSANSRSAAGSLDVTDYLETVKLMGGAGINALDQSKVEFIIDPNTHWKTLALPELLTKDVFSSPTIEGGRLTGLWGYKVNVSGQMHKMSSVRKANSAGKIDQDVTTNNAYGAILAVRFDQWRFGWQRRMTLETERYARADTNEIVAMFSCGLIQRDTEASAETYYVGV